MTDRRPRIDVVDEDAAAALLIAHLRAIPLWERTASLHGIAAALACAEDRQREPLRKELESAGLIPARRTNRRHLMPTNRRNIELPGAGSREPSFQPERGSQTDRIARRAYQRYEQRGQEHGRDQEDWFEAERELMREDDEHIDR